MHCKKTKICQFTKKANSPSREIEKFAISHFLWRIYSTRNISWNLFEWVACSVEQQTRIRQSRGEMINSNTLFGHWKMHILTKSICTNILKGCGQSTFVFSRKYKCFLPYFLNDQLFGEIDFLFLIPPIVFKHENGLKFNVL